MIKILVVEGVLVVFEIDIIYQFGRVFINWLVLEIQKVEDEVNVIDWDGLEYVEKMIIDVLVISKQELSVKSQLLLVVEVIL